MYFVAGTGVGMSFVAGTGVPRENQAKQRRIRRSVHLRIIRVGEGLYV